MCWLALLHVVKSVNSSNSRQINRLTKQKMILWPGIEIVCSYFLFIYLFLRLKYIKLVRHTTWFTVKIQYLFNMAGYGLSIPFIEFTN